MSYLIDRQEAICAIYEIEPYMILTNQGLRLIDRGEVEKILNSLPPTLYTTDEALRDMLNLEKEIKRKDEIIEKMQTSIDALQVALDEKVSVIDEYERIVDKFFETVVG